MAKGKRKQAGDGCDEIAAIFSEVYWTNFDGNSDVNRMQSQSA
jgi:hypothetical protein